MPPTDSAPSSPAANAAAGTSSAPSSSSGSGIDGSASGASPPGAASVPPTPSAPSSASREAPAAPGGADSGGGGEVDFFGGVDPFAGFAEYEADRTARPAEAHGIPGESGNTADGTQPTQQARPTQPSPQAPTPAATEAPAAQERLAEAAATGPTDGAAQPSQSPRFSPAEPGRIAEALANPENFAAFVQARTDAYKLSAEDIEAMETDAPAHIPKLLARVEANIMRATLQHFQNIVPAMMQRMQTLDRAHEKSAGEFFAAHTYLDPTKHADTATQFARLFRQMDPKITKEQLYQRVAAATAAQYGINPAALAGGPAAAAPAKPQPFVPAQGGPSAQAGSVTREGEWEGLGATYA